MEQVAAPSWKVSAARLRPGRDELVTGQGRVKGDHSADCHIPLGPFVIAVAIITVLLGPAIR